MIVLRSAAMFFATPTISAISSCESTAGNGASRSPCANVRNLCFNSSSGLEIPTATSSPIFIEIKYELTMITITIPNAAYDTNDNLLLKLSPSVTFVSIRETSC